MFFAFLDRQAALSFPLPDSRLEIRSLWETMGQKSLAYLHRWAPGTQCSFLLEWKIIGRTLYLVRILNNFIRYF